MAAVSTELVPAQPVKAGTCSRGLLRPTFWGVGGEGGHGLLWMD